jgi:hypothetical protein
MLPFRFREIDFSLLGYAKQLFLFALGLLFLVKEPEDLPREVFDAGQLAVFFGRNAEVEGII